MISASTEFNTQVNKTSRTFKARLLQGGQVLSGEISKAQIYRGACGDTFSVGSIYVPYIDVTISDCDKALENTEVLLQIGLLMDDESIEYINMGYYTVTQVQNTAYQSTLTAVGRISAKLNALPELPAAQTVQNLAAAITAKTGISIVFNGLTAAGTIEKDLKGLTCKDLLEVITSVLGGFATEDSNGNIVVSKFSVAAPIAYNGDRTTELPEFSDYDYSVTGVKVVVSDEGEDENGNTIPEVSYTSGTPRITIANAYMTEALFTVFAGNIVGYSYRPGTIPLALGDPRLEPWDCIEFTDVTGNVYIVPCLNIYHSFDGGLSTTITAPGSSESEESSTTAGPLTQQLERVSADLFTAQQAIINRLTVDDLEAENARLGYVTADEINAKLGDFGYITADEINAQLGEFGYIKADTADLKYANITLSNIDTANIEKAAIAEVFANLGLIQNAVISNGHITGSLDSVKINADLINAGTLAVDRLLLKGSDKSLLYALNNLGELTSTNVDTLDGDILTDNTITADKLVAHSITSNEITTENITGAQGWINLANGTFNYGNKLVFDGANLYIRVDSLTTTAGAEYTTASDIQSSINSLEIGSRNLILQSEHFTHVRTDTTKSWLLPYPQLKNSEYGIGLINQGGEFTLSFDYEITGITTACNLIPCLEYANLSYTKIGLTIPLAVGDNSGRAEYTFTPTATQMQWGRGWLLSGFGAGQNENAVINIEHIKLEKGNKVTDWTPAPEDIDTATQAAYDAADAANDSIGTLSDTVEGVSDNVDNLKTAQKNTAGKVTELENNISTVKQTADKVSTQFTELNGNVTKWFDFTKDGVFEIGRSDSPVVSRQTNESYAFVDQKTEEELLRLDANGATVDTLNADQVRFGRDNPQWAVREGAYISGKGYNLNDVWIGG